MVLHGTDGSYSATQFLFFRVLPCDARVCVSGKAYAQCRTVLEAYEQALQTTTAKHNAEEGKNVYQSHVPFETYVKSSIENGEPCRCRNDRSINSIGHVGKGVLPLERDAQNEGNIDDA